MVAWKYLMSATLSSLAACIGVLLLIAVGGEMLTGRFSDNLSLMFIKLLGIFNLALPVAMLMVFLFAAPVIGLLRFSRQTKIFYDIAVFHIVFGLFIYSSHQMHRA